MRNNSSGGEVSCLFVFTRGWAEVIRPPLFLAICYSPTPALHIRQRSSGTPANNPFLPLLLRAALFCLLLLYLYLFFQLKPSTPQLQRLETQMSGLGSPALRVSSPEVMNKILLRSSTPGTWHFMSLEPPTALINYTSFQRKRLILGPYPSHGTPKLTVSRHTVLLYLEGMQTDPPDSDSKDTDSPTSPRSQTAPARVTSPMLRGSNSGGSGARRSARSELSYVTDKRQNGLGLNGVPPTERDNDIRSDVQEGRGSEVRTMGHVSVVGCSISFSRSAI